MPSTARWRAHLEREILPFWRHPDALGDAERGFPTFRCNDGAAYDPAAPCPELGDAPAWIKDELGTEYARMMSRQTFAYGVGFHVTGDPALLVHARAGVEFLRAHAYDRETGSAASYWRDGAAGPPVRQRTTQDLAYAQLGLAFYYYLTRDPDVLADLERLADYVFRAYAEPAWGGMLRWVLEDAGDHRADQQELVAQLDQINAYLLLVAPLVAEPAATAWRERLVKLTRIIHTRFFAPEHGMFWGAIHSAERMALGTHHTDFGHTAKSLWMLRMVGALVGDRELVTFADRHLPPLAARAYNPDTGCWGSSLSAAGEVARHSSWWTSAELSQAVATLALARRGDARDNLVDRYLAGSYRCWLESFVDRERGGVWPFLPPDGVARGNPAKQFHWKNGYHEAELALVALITTAGLRGESLPLYFAFATDPPRDRVRPYFYRGRVASVEPIAIPAELGGRGQQVTFADIAP